MAGATNDVAYQIWRRQKEDEAGALHEEFLRQGDALRAKREEGWVKREEQLREMGVGDAGIEEAHRNWRTRMRQEAEERERRFHEEEERREANLEAEWKKEQERLEREQLRERFKETFEEAAGGKPATEKFVMRTAKWTVAAAAALAIVVSAAVGYVVTTETIKFHEKRLTEAVELRAAGLSAKAGELVEKIDTATQQLAEIERAAAAAVATITEAAKRTPTRSPAPPAEAPVRGERTGERTTEKPAAPAADLDALLQKLQKGMRGGGR